VSSKLRGKPYRVIYGKHFLKELKKVVKSGNAWVKDKAQEVIDEIQYDPYTKRAKADIKLVSSKEEGVYRVRVGSYRMSYEVDEQEWKISFVLIFPRGGKGYKKTKRKR